MKKKALKIGALALAAALMAGLGILANSLVGNPISKRMAQKTAENHLRQTYANTDFYIDTIGFNFKDGNYYVHIKSPSSMDTYFTLYITMGGKLRMDTYPDVLSGENTARRLNQSYRELADTVFESPVFPYQSRISYGDLEFISRQWLGGEDLPPYALIQEELELDRLYDIPALGAEAGHLVVYIEEETVSVERAAEIMLDVKRLMDEGGVPFYAMDFVLQYPPAEPDGPRPEGDVMVRDFLCAHIYEEDMIQRVKAADEALRAYYAEQDAARGKAAGESK